MQRPQQTEDQNLRSSLFLDTATQIARHWHCHPIPQEIGEQLQGRKLYCSRYVKCQYKATLLNSIICLHNLLLGSEDLQQAQHKANHLRFSKEAGLTLTQGVRSRVTDIASWIDMHSKYEEQLDTLRDLIEDTWETMFHHGIAQPLIDETGCVYADGPPKMGVTGRYDPVTVSCRKTPTPKCGIGGFWQDHHDELRLLAAMDTDALKAKVKDKPELVEIRECAQRICGGELPSGNACTRTLSDAVICIESVHCPEEVRVHSTNRKHFEPLCEVLGLDFEVSASTTGG